MRSGSDPSGTCMMQTAQAGRRRARTSRTFRKLWTVPEPKRSIPFGMNRFS